MNRTDTGLRVVFDTLEGIDDAPLPVWRLWAFITHGDVEASRFLKQELSDKEYAAVGQIVCASLAAAFEEE